MSMLSNYFFDRVMLAYIHDPAVYITKLLEPKQAGSMGGVIEGIALMGCQLSI